MMELKIAKMEKDIEYIKKEQREIKELVKQNHKNLDDRFDSFITAIQNQFIQHEAREVENIKKMQLEAEDKFSRKYVEKAFWWALATIGTILITALFTLLLK